MTKEQDKIICNEDEQECWKCSRAVKGSLNPCMIGQISQNCVVEVKRREDIEQELLSIEVVKNFCAAKDCEEFIEIAYDGGFIPNWYCHKHLEQMKDMIIDNNIDDIAEARAEAAIQRELENGHTNNA
jgi:hypothetical protein